MGEGGAVFAHNGTLKPLLESFRDWGRDCFCATGQDNTCKKRFTWQLGNLPAGYDHKYTYSHAGYNLKITDMQAACGLAQLDKLPDFIARRKTNITYLHERLRACEEFPILPQATPGSDPSWFGFPITLRPAAGVSRVDLLRHLDQHKIGTRLLFRSNFTRQPYFQGRLYRVAGDLPNTDRIMNDTFWIGLYPGLSVEMLDYAASQIREQLPQARHPPAGPCSPRRNPGSDSRGRSRLDSGVNGYNRQRGTTSSVSLRPPWTPIWTRLFSLAKWSRMTLRPFNSRV